MKRLFLMHGKNYNDQDPTGWYMSEKLDGGRAFWDPSSRGKYTDYSNDRGLPTGLWSRDGKIIAAPGWWLDKLPNMPLDGELYLGRRRFQETMSIVRCNIPDHRWENIKFCVFDMPTHMRQGIIEFKNKVKVVQKRKLYSFEREYPFYKIYDYLLKKLKEHDNLKLVKQITCKGYNHLDEFLEEVKSQSGEGIMLRDPKSFWEPYRTNTLLKIKPTEEAEVKVTGFFYGEGKYKDMMGSLEVEWEGKRFQVSGFTDEERKVEYGGVPFARGYCKFYFNIGQNIKIQYRELSDGGIPKEARYIRP